MPRLLLAAALVVSLAGVACGAAAPAEPEGDPGDSSSDYLTSTIAAGGCNRAKILASVHGARRTALVRGFKWLDDNVPYSQSRTHEGYRTDCSGFVSMCWDTGTSFTTAIYAEGGGGTSSLGGYDALRPADALVRHGHIMLFTGWADNAHTGVCALEQASTASDMQFRVHSVASLRSGGYKAIQRNAIANGEAPSDPSDPSDPSTDPGDGSDPQTDPSEPATRPGTGSSGSSGSGGTRTPPPPEDDPEADVPPEEDPSTAPPPRTPPKTTPGDPSTPSTGVPDDPASSSDEGTSKVPSPAPKKTKKTSSSSGDDGEDDGSLPGAAPVASAGCSAAPTGAEGGGPSGLAAFGLALAGLAVVRRRRRERRYGATAASNVGAGLPSR